MANRIPSMRKASWDAGREISRSNTGNFPREPTRSTGWTEEGIRLSKGSNGDWQTDLNLDPGEYQYRLRVDGQWQDHAEAQERVANPFGTENCILKVS